MQGNWDSQRQVSLLGKSSISFFHFMINLTAHSIIAGAPAGGLLYSRFGFRAPFIFTEICTLVDLLLRLLIIERDVAIKWGYDPATGRDISATTDLEASSTDDRSDATGPSQSRLIPLHSSSEQTPASVDPKEVQSAVDSCAPAANNSTVSPVHKSLPILSIIWQIAKSSRARVALMVTLVSGYVVLASWWSC